MNSIEYGECAEFMDTNGQITRLSPLFEVRLVGEGKNRHYEFAADESFYPGVTTVLGAAIPKPALLPWAVKMMGENVREALMALHPSELLTETVIESIVLAGKNIYKKKASAAADIGTRAHKQINEYIEGRWDVVDMGVVAEDIRPCVDAFLDWKARQTLTFEFGDTKIGSRLFGYGGSLDMVAFDGSTPLLIDIKTSKGIYPEMALQLAAYAQAFKETYGVEVKDAIILRLGKDKPEFEVKRVSNLNKAFEGFLAALKLYQLSKWSLFEI